MECVAFIEWHTIIRYTRVILNLMNTFHFNKLARGFAVNVGVKLSINPIIKG